MARTKSRTITREATCSEVEELLNLYAERGGIAEQIEEGVLGHGRIFLHGAGLRNFLIEEVYVNCWCSLHVIKILYEIPEDLKEYIY